MLVHLPDQSFAEILCGCLERTPPFAGFHFAVAWARKRGVEYIAKALEGFPGQTMGIVGMNYRRTSYEALYLLYERLEELWVFFKHPFQVFHSKLYYFAPDPDIEQQKGIVIVGSSNLTKGGLTTNLEVNWLQELSQGIDDDQLSMTHVQQYFQQLTEVEYCHRVESIDYLNDLLEGKYISSERSLAAATRRAARRSLRPTTGISLPEAPPPRVAARPSLVVPVPVVEEPETAAEIGELPKGSEAVTETLFYVRTLTPNDVLKARDERTGTWEPDLGLEARDEHPQFWGWPDEYEVVHAERTEWRTNARYHSRRLPEGIIRELCLWFRPERPGHPAEHRFRPDASVKTLVVPPEFDTNAIMVVRRLPESSDATFRVDFVLPNDPEFGDYVQYLTTRKPRHRRGYGTTAEIED